MSDVYPDWLPDKVKSCLRDGTHLVEFDEDSGECAACGYSESAEWDFEIDQQGPIADSALPADKNGWCREDVWCGGGDAGDDAIGNGYTSRYRKGDQVLDLTYYVTGHHQNYDVELMAHSFTADADGSSDGGPDEEIDYSTPFDFGFTEYEAALWAARNGAMGDERFKLG